MAYTTINKSTDYFNAQTWAGNDGSDRAMTTSFQPDWVWIKATDGTQDHQIYDAVRGATKDIHSNNTDAEGTTTNGLKSFTSTGFTIGGDAGVNDVSLDYVGWSWKAGNSSGSSNSDGDITSTVSANTTAGFSIVKWTGSGANATIGHGLGAVPKMYIVKNVSATNDWNVYHHKTGNEYRLFLNTTAASEDNASAWNDTSPTSSVFSVGTNTNVNQSGSTMIAYVFTEKKGYSKFGSYTGNGNANGAFIYTGFKPAFLIVKRSSDVEDWKMFDNKRPGYNLTNLRLKPNGNESEASSGGFDFTSNGFKARSTDAAENASGSTYIYMAFAEAPLVGSNNTPATAR